MLITPIIVSWRKEREKIVSSFRQEKTEDTNAHLIYDKLGDMI